MLTKKDLKDIKEIIEGTIESKVPGIVEGIIESKVPGIVEGIIESKVPGIVEGIIESKVPGIVEGIIESKVPDIVEGIVEKVVENKFDDFTKGMLLPIADDLSSKIKANTKLYKENRKLLKCIAKRVDINNKHLENVIWKIEDLKVRMDYNDEKHEQLKANRGKNASNEILLQR
jgi:predicted transcriptional regulator